MEQLTVQQAKELGYETCSPLDEETTEIPIDECDFNRTYILIDPVPRPFAFDEDHINSLLLSYLEDQEEFYTQTTEIEKAISEFDFSAVTAQLNEKISGVKFIWPTNIQLIP